MATQEQYQQLCAAILHLDGRCDGAVKHDEKGFNGRDTRFGKSLAEQISVGRMLTDNQQRAALRMVQTYRHTQLGHLDVPLPSEYGEPYDPRIPTWYTGTMTSLTTKNAQRAVFRKLESGRYGVSILDVNGKPDLTFECSLEYMKGHCTSDRSEAGSWAPADNATCRMAEARLALYHGWTEKQRGDVLALVGRALQGVTA